ncbi:putative transcription factor bHLH041 [Curcuma longa]|uniref:putative transcription factor bHLH041 n=1 Tax=Curcuma longa TaxID=136217 RepID=UPI003D9EC5C4
MDSIFLLSPNARRRFLCIAGGSLGCSYICLWAPLPLHYLSATNSYYLASKDGWHHEDNGGRPSSSSGTSSNTKSLFEAYMGSLIDIQHSSSVPGLAYTNNLPYVELGDSELIDLASLRVQRQFYQEAGIKTAIFLRCPSGEIEIGTTISRNYANLHMNARKVFTREFIQQSQLGEELLPMTPLIGHNRSNSSSSISSPLVLSNRGESPEHVSSLLPHHITAKAYSNTSRDDAVIARAIFTVISSTTNTSSRLSSKAATKAFKPYDNTDRGSCFAPITDGQRMVKRVFSLLRNISKAEFVVQKQEVRAATSSDNNLLHTISERQRRKKLNEKFETLRMVLPQGTKKDKASVLTNARNFLNALKTQISELKERNQQLEMQLKLHEHEHDSNGERVEVHVAESTSESTSTSKQITLSILVRTECNMINLILSVLEYLNKKADLTMVSMEASTRSPRPNIHMKASITVSVKDCDFNKELFKEVVVEAVNDVLDKSTASTIVG